MYKTNFERKKNNSNITNGFQLHRRKSKSTTNCEQESAWRVTMKDNNQNKHDCELFLRAFEKPTQIYRYLRMRRLFSPLFLQRNLSYLRGRTTKRKFKRRNFGWPAFLKQLKPIKSNDLSENFLIFKFLGFFDENVSDTESAIIEIHLVSRNKNQSNLLLKTIPVEINPSIIINPTPITISKDQLTRYVTDADQSCVLLIEVSYVENQKNDNTERAQRSKKRKRISHDAKLPVYNKKGKCDLLEGEYELNLDDNGSSAENVPFRKVDHLVWAADIPKMLAGDKRYFQNRSLKFILQWSSDDGTKTKSTSTSPIHNDTISLTADATDWCGIRTGSTTSLSTSSGILSDMSSDDAEVAILTKKMPNTTTTLPIVLPNRSPFVELLNIGSHVTYRFIYNDDLSQKTDAWGEFFCPWCLLNCMSLHPLLMHLRLCHDRFKFSYTLKDDAIQVNVSINERYNCALSPLKEKMQLTDQKDGRPCKRKPYTKVLVSPQQAKKRKICLTYEDLEEAIASDIDSSDAEEDKFTISRGELIFDGHDRGYYRTTNNMKYTHRADFDEDSEGEMDPGWLQAHTKKLLEDFTDVNEGEKEMLKMWNLHVMKHNFVGDSQMPLACEMFVDEKGDQVLDKNLYKNFLLHLTSLHDYNMLSPNQMYSIIQRIQAKRTDQSCRDTSSNC